MYLVQHPDWRGEGIVVGVTTGALSSCQRLVWGCVHLDQDLPLVFSLSLRGINLRELDAHFQVEASP